MCIYDDVSKVRQLHGKMGEGGDTMWSPQSVTWAGSRDQVACRLDLDPRMPPLACSIILSLCSYLDGAHVFQCLSKFDQLNFHDMSQKLCHSLHNRMKKLMI
jgi:hypothetical protein